MTTTNYSETPPMQGCSLGGRVARMAQRVRHRRHGHRLCAASHPGVYPRRLRQSRSRPALSALRVTSTILDTRGARRVIDQDARCDVLDDLGGIRLSSLSPLRRLRPSRRTLCSSSTSHCSRRSCARAPTVPPPGSGPPILCRGHERYGEWVSASAKSSAQTPRHR
jgi:hypothetical protein